MGWKKSNYEAQIETNQSNERIANNLNNANIAMNAATNASNLQLAREQNDWNVQQWNRQQAADLAQWNRENEYNSPVNQAQRLMEAGINPAMQGGVDNGNASGSPYASPLESADLANQKAAHIDAKPDYESPKSAYLKAREQQAADISRSLNDVMAVMGKRAEIAESQQRILESEVRSRQAEQEIALANGLNPMILREKNEDIRNKLLQNGVSGLDYLKQKHFFDMGLHDVEYNGKVLQNNEREINIMLMAAQQRKENALADQIEKSNKWIDKEKAAGIANKMAQVGLFNSESNLNDKVAALKSKELDWFDQTKEWEIREIAQKWRACQTDNDLKKFELDFEKKYGFKPSSNLQALMARLGTDAFGVANNFFNSMDSKLYGVGRYVKNAFNNARQRALLNDGSSQLDSFVNPSLGGLLENYTEHRNY